MTTRIDFSQIRLDYSLRSVLEFALGEQTSKNTWVCPFHDDRHNPNLKLFTDTTGTQRFKCFSARCGATGDVIDFIQRYHKLPSLLDAAKFLTGDISPSPAPPPKKQTPPTENINHLIPRVKHYQGQVNGTIDYWYGQGLMDGAIETFRLGYANRCPTYPDSPSFTIPYFYANDLVSLRHRLAKPNGSGKYRPEMAGLNNRLFFPAGLKDVSGEIFALSEEDEALLVEGEVKTMYLWQMGYRVAGIPGAETWKDSWSRFFSHLKRLYICLDPMAEKDTERIVSRITKSLTVPDIRIVNLPTKPDDFFHLHQGTVQDFQYYLDYSRLVS